MLQVWIFFGFTYPFLSPFNFINSRTCYLDRLRSCWPVLGGGVTRKHFVSSIKYQSCNDSIPFLMPKCSRHTTVHCYACYMPTLFYLLWEEFTKFMNRLHINVDWNYSLSHVYVSTSTDVETENISYPLLSTARMYYLYLYCSILHWHWYMICACRVYLF